jgi:hypothetical protein
MTDDRPFEVLSRTKIRLGPVAKQFAKDYGLTLTDMARYLIDRHYNGDDTVHGQDHESEFGHARMLQAKKTGTPEIPAKVLKQLASLNLPPIPFVYEACLEKLLRGA